VRTAGGVVRDEFFVSAFYASLAFIIVGVGFLKANISTIVGSLYPPDDVRRDGAYTIFYIGINVGAALGALIAGWLGQTYGWAWGFGAAGVGMLLGLAVFILGRPLLEGHAEPPRPELLARKVGPINTEWCIYLGSLLGVLLVWQLIQYQALVGTLLGIAGAIVVAWILYTSVRHLSPHERDRTLLALVLMGFSILFWALFEQAGSSLNIYADQRVDRTAFGVTVPPSVFQSLNSIYIVLLGPLFAGLWVFLGRHGWEPSAPAKFGFGLVLLGIGFLVLVWGAGTGNRLTPLAFLFLIYFFHTAGELCLSPVGLSAMTKLAVPRMVGLIMGTWFLSTAAGNFVSGLIARATGGGEGLAMSRVHDVYATVGWYSVGAGAIVILVAPLLKRLAHERSAAAVGRGSAGERELAEPKAAGLRPEPRS
jgi:POT family proton-dependent oligopeptide transporter